MDVSRILSIFVAILLKPVMIQNNSKTRVVGVGISLEQTTYAIVDIRGNIIAEDNFITSDYPYVNDYISVLSEKILTLVEQNGGYESIRSIGISTPSGNFKTGCMENSPNMPWKGVVPLAAMLRDRLGLATALANNAHVMTLGEQAFGAGHGMQDFVLITIGDGLGSCICSNGQVHIGSNGFAGEIGHTCVKHGGRPCGCGNRGCLETYAATKGIITTAHELMDESNEPSLMRNIEQLTPKIITALCEQGDKLAQETYRRTGYMLGIGLANYASIFDPEAFIFTGGIAGAGHWLLEPAAEAFESHVFHNIENKIKFIVSNLNEHERGVLGASVLAWDVKEYSLFK